MLGAAVTAAAFKHSCALEGMCQASPRAEEFLAPALQLSGRLGSSGELALKRSFVEELRSLLRGFAACGRVGEWLLAWATSSSMPQARDGE